MKRILRTTASGVALAGLTGLGYVWLTVARQGAPASAWKSFPWAEVRFDRWGIPTVEAENWPKVVLAQGYVVASERLFQMDLIRRMAGGRLAEWAGSEAFLHDAERQMEGRIGVARRAADALPPKEREYCDAYASGVNEFIASSPDRWGVEYRVLGEPPEPWTCADSLLVLLALNEQLTSSAEQEAAAELWRRNLSPAWERFLFTADHPWNRPMFGEPSAAGPTLPPPVEHVARQPLRRGEDRAANFTKRPPVGSNSWAWRGTTGAFMANDPHLTHTVPGIWYAMRLRVNREDWVVGAAVPGVPGILIGMNPALAWTLTNTGEDVDDLLEERLSEDGRHYLAGLTADGKEEWRPIRLEPLSIKVKGEAEPRRLLARFTHRGPLSQRSWLKDSAAFSRQWLPLKDGILRLPIYGLARSLEEFDQVMDDMRTPSQNVLVMNRKGDILYRTSGSGVIRRRPGHRPMPALDGEWLGFAPMDQRPRRYIRADERRARHVATANQRIWTDGYGHLWESDDRQERLDRALSSRDDFSREDMERLQLDTQGRFRQLLLGWILSHAGGVDGRAAEVTRRWREWDGTSRGDSQAFALAERGEELLTRILLARVQERFSSRDRQAPYRWPLQRAWLTTVLEASGDEGLKPFGLTPREVAGHLLARLVDEAGRLTPHPERNRWRAQHPFHAAIPLVGQLFAVDEYPQWGADDLVNAENPYYGPSLRLVWNLQQPWDSTWIFPVGQSGHVGKAHYKDLQRSWFAGERLGVFDDGSDWGFGGQAAKSH